MYRCINVRGRSFPWQLVKISAKHHLRHLHRRCDLGLRLGLGIGLEGFFPSYLARTKPAMQA